MTTRTLSEILADHTAWRFGKGGRRLAWSKMPLEERTLFLMADLRGVDLGGANLIGADLRGVDLSGADLYKVDLSGANLRGADLRWADLRWANLRWANLSAADLSGAYLRGAYLRGAYLRGADLSGADLSGGLHIVQGPTRSDGYAFFLHVCAFGLHEVAAGCRRMTIEGYREHVAREYPNTPKAAETLAILDYLEARRDQIFAEWRGN